MRKEVLLGNLRITIAKLQYISTGTYISCRNLSSLDTCHWMCSVCTHRLAYFLLTVCADIRISLYNVQDKLFHRGHEMQLLYKLKVTFSSLQSDVLIIELLDNWLHAWTTRHVFLNTAHMTLRTLWRREMIILCWIPYWVLSIEWKMNNCWINGYQWLV